ncbi:helix-turn-helix protein [Tamaricihabitans halophyticus]|uniref:Helix-turn-helix protein n=1 Tax=Tamaricihabitans halophyticus TaxID=1262583 RepID=A0A4R2R5V2_9PSEU|nr:helix-turn-helix transcriptional regulator [Tamaricihabitans halophyticus]TCP57199.1 helix-turn-helix protein [Tamaricihabitans halophyticus]
MKKPNFRARQLGRTLRRLRDRAGLGQWEVAERLRCATSKISRIEAGQVPVYAEFELLLDIYGVVTNDWPEYARMFDRARTKGWWRAYGVSDKGFVSLEAEASELHEFQLGYIPGLFQTESYIRTNFAHSSTAMRGSELDKAVEIRRRRQRRLTEEPVLRMHAIIDETALWRPVLSPEEQRAQLRHVIACAGLPTVRVQVLPVSRGAHSGRAGSFSLLSYTEPEEPDIAYVEYGFGSTEIEDASEVSTARLLFDHLAGIALGERESITLIERVIAET